MTDQGYGFGNLLNNPMGYDWSQAPNVGFKGGDFQSLLKPSAPAVEDWRSNPDAYMKKLNELKKQNPNATQEDLNKALSLSPPNSRLDDSVAGLVEQAAYNQSPKAMQEQLEMGLKVADEQARKMLKYQTLANFPGQLTAAIAGNTSQIPEINNRAFQSVPSMNIQAPGYSAPQVRYFS